MGDDVSVGAYVHISAIWFGLRTFENHRDGRICRQEVGVFTVDRFGRPSLIFEDLSTFHTRNGEERAFSLGNVEGRGVVARESWVSEDERALRVFGVFVGLLDVSKRRGCCGRYGRLARCASVWAHSFLGRVSREFETRTVRARSGKRSGFTIERSACSCALCLAMRGTCAPFPHVTLTARARLLLAA